MDADCPTPEQAILGYLMQIADIRKHIGVVNLSTMALDIVVHLRKYGYVINQTEAGYDGAFAD